jgi:hypothetical protein
MNGVGWGTTYSPILYVTTCTVPTSMNTLVAGAINPWNITISWPDLTTNNGGDIPQYYQVEWYNTNTSAWNIISTPSMGKYLTFTHCRTTYIFPSNST